MTTGLWSQGCIIDGHKYGKAHEVVDPKKYNFRNIDDPSQWDIQTGPEYKFFHYCDNETVHGFEF